MKNFILRSPETDRKKVTVPTSADDLQGAVLANYRNDVATVFTALAQTRIQFDTRVEDTHDAVTVGTEWKFTCPASWPGFYNFQIGYVWSTNDVINVQLARNGVVSRVIATTNSVVGLSCVYVSLLLNLEAGDEVWFTAQSTAGSTGAAAGGGVSVSWIDIWRLWDTSVVATDGGIDASGGGSSGGSRTHG